MVQLKNYDIIAIKETARHITQLGHWNGGLQDFRREDGKEEQGCWTLLRKGQIVKSCL